MASYLTQLNKLAAVVLAVVLFGWLSTSPAAAQIPVCDNDPNWQRLPTAPGTYPGELEVCPGGPDMELTTFLVEPALPCGAGYVHRASIWRPWEGMELATWLPVYLRGAGAYQIRFTILTYLPDDGEISIQTRNADGETTALNIYRRYDFTTVREAYTVESWNGTIIRYKEYTYVDVVVQGDISGNIVISFPETARVGTWAAPIDWYVGGLQIGPYGDALPSPCTIDLIGYPNWPLTAPEPTPTQEGGEPHPTPTPTPTLEGGVPHSTPTPSRTPWPTSAPPQPTAVQTPTPWAASTIAPVSTATAVPLPTFSSISPGSLSLPSIGWSAMPVPEFSSITMPGLQTAPVAAWATVPAFTPLEPLQMTPGASEAAGHPAVGGILEMMQRADSVAAVWGEPIAAGEAAIISGTGGIPGIAVIGHETVQMIEYSGSIFQFVKALRWYMPNLWPLFLALLVSFSIIMGQRLIKFFVAVISTAIEIMRRVWDAIPFKFS